MTAGDFAGLAWALSWVIVVVALFVVPRNRRPSSATAWLLVIALLPFLGAFLFLLIGSPKLSRRRRAQQTRIDAWLEARVTAVAHDPATASAFAPRIPPEVEPFVRLSSALGKLPACAGNRVDVLADYDDAIRSMTEAVEGAREYVHVEFYIVALDATTEPFVKALEAARGRGVAVRVLADHIGSRKYPRRQELVERLAAVGILLRWMLPVLPLRGEWNRPDLRNHRKLLVVDGAVGYTGSINMIDRSYDLPGNLRRGIRYVDLVARLEGPVVAELGAVFLTDWYSETGERLDAAQGAERAPLPGMAGDTLCQVLPSGPGYATDNNLKLFVALIHAARRRLVIASPYFVPDESLMVAITSAAQRGVRVTLYSSEVADQRLVHHAQRSYYEELLAAGVEVRLVRAPVILHSKHLSVDDHLAVVGSSNLDMRSLTLNLEVTLVAYDRGTVAALRDAEDGYSRQSVALDLGEWRARSLGGALLDNLARLTAALQ